MSLVCPRETRSQLDFVPRVPKLCQGPGQKEAPPWRVRRRLDVRGSHKHYKDRAHYLNITWSDLISLQQFSVWSITHIRSGHSEMSLLTQIGIV